MKTTVSDKLTDSPCALVAGMFGWTGNMERLAMANAHQKTDDPQREYYMKQKKNFEINPRHPVIKDLLRRVKDDPEDATAKETANVLFSTCNINSHCLILYIEVLVNSIYRPAFILQALLDLVLWFRIRMSLHKR